MILLMKVVSSLNITGVTMGFRALNWTSWEAYKTGESNPVEPSRLARTETRHDLSTSSELVRTSRMRQRSGSTADIIRRAL